MFSCCPDPLNRRRVQRFPQTRLHDRAAFRSFGGLDPRPAGSLAQEGRAIRTTAAQRRAFFPRGDQAPRTRLEPLRFHPEIRKRTRNDRRPSRFRHPQRRMHSDQVPPDARRLRGNDPGQRSRYGLARRSAFASPQQDGQASSASRCAAVRPQAATRDRVLRR